jgi:hypothetical protein
MCAKSQVFLGKRSAAPLANCTAALLDCLLHVKGITKAEKTLDNTTYTSPSPHPSMWTPI